MLMQIYIGARNKYGYICISRQARSAILHRKYITRSDHRM